MLWNQVHLGLSSDLVIINSAFLPLGKILPFSKENKCGEQKPTGIVKRIRKNKAAQSTGHRAQAQSTGTEHGLHHWPGWRV